MEDESLESVYQFDYIGCHFTSDGDDAADMNHRMAMRWPSHGHRRLALSRRPVARQPLTPVTEAAPLRTDRLLDPDARQRGVDPNAKSAGNTQRFQLPATTPHHREVVSRGGHQAFIPPSDGCANAEALVAWPYPAAACRPPSAPCGVGPGVQEIP